MKRCAWVNMNNKLYIDYHDNEWWIPIYDDKLLFEMLILEGVQAWLSWETILKKRKAYKESFDDFDVIKISKYWENKIKELLSNEWIIRNKLKINSTIKNAKVFLEIQKEFKSFNKYLWAFIWNKQIKNSFKALSEIPAKTKLSETISKDLKKRWMNFVWPTIIYAYMQAIWLVNDHEVWCYKYE